MLLRTLSLIYETDASPAMKPLQNKNDFMGATKFSFFKLPILLPIPFSRKQYVGNLIYLLPRVVKMLAVAKIPFSYIFYLHHF
jgi:hypothetical protein